MTELEKLASRYVDERQENDGFYDAFIAGYETALRIHDVVGRSEQLIAFKKFCQDNYGIAISNRIIDEFKKYGS